MDENTEFLDADIQFDDYENLLTEFDEQEREM